MEFLPEGHANLVLLVACFWGGVSTSGHCTVDKNGHNSLIVQEGILRYPVFSPVQRFHSDESAAADEGSQDRTQAKQILPLRV